VRPSIKEEKEEKEEEEKEEEEKEEEEEEEEAEVGAGSRKRSHQGSVSKPIKLIELIPKPYHVRFSTLLSIVVTRKIQ